MKVCVCVYHLVEVVQGLVQVGVHACGWLVGDFDGVLQDALRDDVALGGGGGFGADEHPEVLVASVAVLLQKFLQSSQPASHQVDVLRGERRGLNRGNYRLLRYYRLVVRLNESSSLRVESVIFTLIMFPAEYL